MPLHFLDFTKGLPNENFPSDHIYLYTEFNFCDKKKEIFFDFNKIIYDKNINYETIYDTENKENENNKEKKEHINISDEKK